MICPKMTTFGESSPNPRFLAEKFPNGNANLPLSWTIHSNPRIWTEMHRPRTQLQVLGGNEINMDQPGSTKQL